MTRIRVATEADAARIATITDAAARAHGPDVYDDDQIEAWVGGDQTANATPEDDDHWIVAERAVGADEERDAIVVGWGRIDVAAAEITGSYVDPEHARSGVGATMIAALEGYARGQGLDEVTLAASKNAVGFYERLGYEDVCGVEHGTDAVVIECREMRKEL